MKRLALVTLSLASLAATACGEGPRAFDDAGASDAGEPSADLVLLYTFDEGGGLIAFDSSGYPGGPRNGLLIPAGQGVVRFTAESRVGPHALLITGGTPWDGGLVTLPSLDRLAPDTLTIAAWIYVQGTTQPPDLFSFAARDDTYMSLTADASGAFHFQFDLAGRTEILRATHATWSRGWHHVAVTLGSGSPYVGLLYLDGTVAAANAAMTIRPRHLGPTSRNAIGAFVLTATMAYWNGYVDDFRIYRRALSGNEIRALMSDS